MMNLPFVTRRKFEELEARVRDIERHFVTKRDAAGTPTETLADVPVEEREKRRLKIRGASWQQLKQVLEATDGGRKPLNNG